MSRDEYSSRQSARDADYQRRYREWVASLSPEDRRELERKGLTEPCVQRHGAGSATGDAADSPLMRLGDDPMRVPDPEPEVTEPETEHVWDAVRRVLGEVICHDNARLTAECLALVSGLCYPGASMTEVARRHGITRAAVSKRCCELSELLQLRPSRAMRSLTARKRYRSARIRFTRSNELPDPASK